MNPNKWPTLREWNVLYLRLLLQQAPSKGWAARTARINPDTLLNQRRKANLDWVEPLHPPQGEVPPPDFMTRFLAETERASALRPPPTPAEPAPEPSAPGQYW